MQNKIPKISVVIPTYNRRLLLEKAINSVLNQSVKPYEIIICDDGSTDNTNNLIKKYNYDNIHWLMINHSGIPAKVRNVGIKKAKGDCIAFLDSDDLWNKDKLKIQIDYLKKGWKFICSNAWTFKPNKKYLVNKKSINNINLFGLIRNNDVICSSVIIDKNILLSLKGFPEDKKFIAYEDYLLWLKYASKYKIKYINKPLVIYRDAPQESVRKYGSSKNEQDIEKYNFIINWMTKNKSNPIIIYYSKFQSYLNKLI